MKFLWTKIKSFLSLSSLQYTKKSDCSKFFRRKIFQNPKELILATLFKIFFIIFQYSHISYDYIHDYIDDHAKWHFEDCIENHIKDCIKDHVHEKNLQKRSSKKKNLQKKIFKGKKIFKKRSSKKKIFRIDLQ